MKSKVGHSRRSLRSKRWLITVIGLSLALLVSTAEGARRVIEFTNATGENVDDLHLELTAVKVDWDNTSPFTSERGIDYGGTHNLYGATIAAGAKATVALENPDVGTIIITKWWWTKGGNAHQDGEPEGKIHTRDNGSNELTFRGGPAAGDGQILVSIAGTTCTLTTTAGHTPDQSATDFVQFLESCFGVGDEALVHYGQDSSNSVTFAGNFLGDPSDSLSAEIMTPDSQQDMELIPITGGDIPTLTEWGMIIFCVLLFGWMAWVIVRRRRRVTVGI